MRRLLHRGFTLMEVLIASTILIMFMTGVFSIYRSGSASFQRGSWKQKAQKESQVFLEELRLYIERGNNALITRDTQIDLLAFPLRLNTLASGTDYDVRTLSANSDILFVNMITPCTLYSNLATTKQAGTWLGGLLTASRRRLTLQPYRDPTALPTAVQPWVPALGTDFLAIPTSQMRMPQVLDEVDSIRFQLASTTEALQLTVTVNLSRTGANVGVDDTRVNQSIRAKILEGVGVSWF